MMRKLGALGIVVGACSIVFIAGCPVPPPSDPAGFVAASATTGGQMYDKWWNVTGVDATEPTGDHALWATRPDMDSNSRTGPDTWRCKECHGWDYKGVEGAYSSGSHRTGFSGLLGTSLTAQEAFDEIKDDHGFGAAGLSDDDIWDLAKFVLTGLIDTDDVLDGDMFSGTADAGQAAYESTCMVCHDADGLGIPPGVDADHDDFVGKIANENPWEFQHKVRFGQPGTAMPPQFGILTDAQLADFGAYSQTLPTEPGDSDPAGFVAADAKAGGQMYDKWWNVTGVDAAEPTTDHALWATRPDMDSNSRTGPDTWRCKECHGWDYKGVDGAYSSGSHKTGFSGLLGTSLTAQEAFDEIKVSHGFGAAGLSDDDIWDLAKFVLTGLIDTDDVLDGDMFSGTADAGQAAFESTCLVCHGADGLSIPPGADADFGDFVGKIADENPWEFQHKVRFGQPGTAMPPQFGILTDAQLADFGAYSQTLPTGP